MNQSDWLEVAALVADLWPNQEWSRETIASSFALVADQPISLRASLKVVRELALEGREFAPPPGVLVAHLKAADSREGFHLLAVPDLIRDLTPEEQERAIAMAEQIRKRIAEIAQAKELAQGKS